jgi:ABC-type transport system substrate-binding protein
MRYLGIGSVAGMAGCIGGDDGGTPTDTGTDEMGTPTVTPTPQDQIEFSEGGTLTVGLTSNPSSFDPPYSSGVPSSVVQNYFYEALTTSDAGGNIYPWLAESFSLEATNQVSAADYGDYMVEIEYAEGEEGDPFPDTQKQIAVRHPDNTPEVGSTGQFLTVDETADAVGDGTFGMQYQFNLHEGVEFHNGEELTAQNVVDSYNRYENSQVSSQVWNNFLHAEMVDDYTVNLYAQRPSAEAIRNIVWLVFPSDHIDLPDGGLDPREGTNPVGTGPWEFGSFSAEESFVVESYDNYWLEDVGIQNKDWFNGASNFPNSPVVDTVEHRIVPESGPRGTALQEGELDITTGLTAQQQTNFDDDDGFTTSEIETGGYLFFQYPVQVEPWGNQSVRQAANHLVPRQTIVDNVSQGWSRPAWTPLPDVAEGAGTTDPEQLREDLKPSNELDRQQAKSLIDDAGVETPIQLQIDTNTNNTDRVAKAELIAESMNKAVDGEQLFEVNVETFEFGSLLGRIFAPDYPTLTNDAGAPTALLVGLSGTFDPGSFCEATHQTSAIGQCCNANGYSNEDLDQMMENAKFGSEVLDDTQERASRYDEIWRDVVDISANSYVDIDLTVAVHSTDVQSVEAFPFPEGLYSYALYGPADNTLAYVDR